MIFKVKRALPPCGAFLAMMNVHRTQNAHIGRPIGLPAWSRGEEMASSATWQGSQQLHQNQAVCGGRTC